MSYYVAGVAALNEKWFHGYRHANPPFDVHDNGTRYALSSEAPVVLRADARILLEAGSPVVGLLQDVRYKEQCLALEAGDLLLAYTDGISEAMTVRMRSGGEERMILAAESGREESAANVLATIFTAADRFTGTAPQHDDMTLLVIQIS
jgi:phosphoserine phosphatase RsbU/P